MMRPGDVLLPVSKTVIQEDVNAYAEASGDHNPLHLDPEFAASTHFGRVVAHGMLVLAYISEMMAQAFGRHWLETGQLKIHFRAPVYPGDRVTTFGDVLRLAEENGDVCLTCSVGCRNQDGEEVINGEAQVTIPKVSNEDVTQ
ncbi:MAG: MaoC family dehydratase [Chloroflexota bacterium]